jgi:hypothetical protein
MSHNNPPASGIDKLPTPAVLSLSPANAKQIAGDHYKKYGNLQPWDVVIAWNMGYLDGTALKYIARWKDKGGISDLKKAIHFLEKLIEVTEQSEAANRTKDLPYPL